MKKMKLNTKIAVSILAAALVLSSISVIAAEMPASYRYSKADARKIALDYFGIEESDIIKADCDFDDGRYEFEFTTDGIRYECDVNALTGNVVDSEIKSKLLDSETVSRYIANRGYISGEEAKELAFDKFNIASDAEIIDFEIELDGNDYEVEFIADGVKYECDVQAVTGKIVCFKSKPQQSPSATQITKETAERLALEHFGIGDDAAVKGMHVDMEHDRYEVEFCVDGMEYECEIHVLTGKVVKAEMEYDD